MSDCSTDAMKPKEPPKTCGTCEHAFNQDIPCCVPVIGCEDIRAFYREVGCNHYTERAETIEQRYQQLEQVAKDMCFELEHRIGVSYRKELETCGVILDD